MTWRDLHGWYDWEATYREAVLRFPNGSTFVEVGCWMGRSICSLAEMMKECGKRFQLVGVDTCRGSGVENGNDNHKAEVDKGGGSFAGQLHRNIIDCGFGDDIDLIVADSERASRFFREGSVDFVFLDGAHDYDSVSRDILTWLRKVKSGGVLAGDDYGLPQETNPVWPEVRQAVKDLLPSHECRPHDAWWYEMR